MKILEFKRLLLYEDYDWTRTRSVYYTEQFFLNIEEIEGFYSRTLFCEKSDKNAEWREVTNIITISGREYILDILPKDLLIKLNK